MTKRSERSVFAFPKNLDTSYKDILKISSYDYVPYQAPGSDSTRNDNLTESGDIDDPDDASRLPTVSYTRLATGNAQSRFIKNEQNVYYLPMPNDLSFTEGMSWESQNVGALGLYGGEFIKSVVGGSGSDFASSVKALSEAGLSEFALQTINSIGVSSSFITQQSAGKVINPYREQVFNGMSPRSFSFSYNFVPTNKDEQNILIKMIKRLREDSLPTTAKSNEILDALESDELENINTTLSEFDSTLQDRWFGVPRVFELTFMTNIANSGEASYRINDKIPKIKPCICKSIEVNYTPDGVWATRVDGASIATEVSFEFEEIEIVVAQDILSGY